VDLRLEVQPPAPELMAFALLILYLILTFVRPGEQIPSIAAWRTMEIVSGICLVAAAFGLLAGRGPTFRAVQTPLVLALSVWILVSVLASTNRPPNVFDAVLDFAKGSGTAFLLVILNLDSMRRLRIAAATLCVMSLFVVGQGALAYHRGVGASRFLVSYAGGPMSEWDGAPTEGPYHDPDPAPAARFAEDVVMRIRGLGFMKDPNDLASTLVAILPLLLAFRRPGARLRNVAVVWLPAAAIVYGVYLTRSRGGVVALAVVIALASRARLGRVMTVFVAAGMLVALVHLGFTGGRAMGVDRSASGRIEAWSEGLQMLKSSPVLGVGFASFGVYHVRAAHNSLVQCFAELGLVGYFLWLALLVLTLDDARAVGRAEEGGEDDHDETRAGEVGPERVELRRWGQAITLSLAGLLVGSFFLSHSYDVMLFILLGLGAAVADVARRQGLLTRSRDPFIWSVAIIGLELVSIVVFWLYMRLLR
jgi:putative inorganic carbon (hco3(-)) transporter